MSARLRLRDVAPVTAFLLLVGVGGFGGYALLSDAQEAMFPAATSTEVAPAVSATTADLPYLTLAGFLTTGSN